MDKNLPKRERNKEQTQQRLIDATIELLRERGFSSIGINAVAEHAGVNKVLIYRYFGGLKGLLEAVASSLNLIKIKRLDLSFDETDTDLHSLFLKNFKSIHNNLKEDDLAIELMIHELSEENELTRSFAETRERQGLDATEQAAELISSITKKTSSESIDIQAAFAIASAGINYLTMRSRTVQMFNGVDISSEEGWDRICSTLATLFDL